ncbi:MAG: rRNA maturation RNase YbeY [Ignavibacteriales bacterium]|nr:rRNA maturation RNase YbeY [Melioribacteraceae bacterium]MCF8435357.1 rRNA maturation RNase YbeY [Ignavibacteriales bacterium]
MATKLTIINTSSKKINKRGVRELVKKLSEHFSFSVFSLEIYFVSSSDISEINKNYLNHEGTTDVITFDYSEVKQRIDSEIYISVQDAEENAKIYSVSLELELKRLIIHGVLHILGYDDKDSSKKLIMKSIEDELTNNIILEKNII